MSIFKGVASKFNNIKFSVKLPLLVVSFSIITAALIGFQAFHRSYDGFASASLQSLVARATTTQVELERYLHSIESDLSFNSKNPFVHDALKDFTYGWRVLENTGINPVQYLQDHYITKNPNPTGSKEELDYANDGSLYSLAHEKYHPWMRKFLRERGYCDIFLFDTKGNLVYTVFKELDYATNLNEGEWKDTDLGHAFRAALQGKEGERFFFDFKPYAPSHGAPASFISAPLVDESGQTAGVLVYQMPIEKINEIITTDVGLGESGKMYLVGTDMLVRNDVRGVEEETILKMQKDLPWVREALGGGKSSGRYDNESGVEKFITAVPMKFNGVSYAIVTEIDEREADAPVYDMLRELLIGILISQTVICVIAYLMGRPISNRVSELADSVKDIAEGKDAEIPSLDAKDELGDIARGLKEISDVGQNALRVKAALDSSGTGVMIAKRDHKITYFNPKLKQLFKKYDDKFTSHLPGFSSEEIVGKTLEAYHTNADELRAILDGDNQVHESELRIDGVIIMLTVSPIMNGEGERIATFVEWRDITIEKATEEEVQQIVEACAAGDFTNRLSLEGKEGFMRKLAEGMNQIGETANRGLDQVQEVLSSLSQGDLTHKMEGDFKGVFDDIKVSLNNTIDKLYAMVGEIRSSTESVNSAAQEISSGSQDLAHRTEQQASTLEETAASMEQMTGTVRQNAENSKKADEISSESNRVASTGAEVVAKAVRAMAEIQESSQKIADIIGVIDDIAFQTNLLALNAAVEAARAGEAGKGFAVVASEVRALAGRSAESSKEIKDLITASVELIDNGFKHVNQSGETFKEITDSVRKTAELIREISQASIEQAKGIDEINSAVSQMDDTTQQNAALVEENTAAARSMSDQVGQLEKLVQFFKVSVAEAMAVDVTPTDSKESNKKEPVDKAKQAHEPAVVNAEEEKKQQNTAPKTPPAADDGWEEF